MTDAVQSRSTATDDLCKMLDLHVDGVRHYLHLQIGKPIVKDLVSAPEIALDNLHREMKAALRSSDAAQAKRISGVSDIVDEAACLIWDELCPGMVMGDDDRSHYENAAKAVLALAQPLPAGDKGEALPLTYGWIEDFLCEGNCKNYDMCNSTEATWCGRKAEALVRAIKATAPQPASNAAEIRQHIGWLKQYVHGMTAENWQDMRLRAERQLDELSREVRGVAYAESMVRLSASEVACYRWSEDTAEHRAMRAAFMDGAAYSVTSTHGEGK